MRYLLILLLAIAAHGQAGLRNPAVVANLNVVHPAAGGGGPSPPAGLLWQEDFEADEFDNAVTQDGPGTIDGNYATSPAPLRETESFRIVTTVGGIARIYSGGGVVTSDPAYAFWEMVIVDSEYSMELQVFWDSGFGPAFKITLDGVDRDGSDTAHTVFITHGTVDSSETVGTMTEGTRYYCWVEYNAGAGTADFGFSTDGTRPTSGDNFISVTSGDGAAANRVVVGGDASDTAVEVILDSVWIDNTELPNF